MKNLIVVLKKQYFVGLTQPNPPRWGGLTSPFPHRGKGFRDRGFNRKFKIFQTLVILILLFSTSTKAQESLAEKPIAKNGDAQFFMRVLLDKIITIGSLKACPSLDNIKNYYYLPNKVKIQTDEPTGKPKFSFVKYVTNKRSGSEEAEIKEGDGGGWVHFLMGLSVSEAELRTAEQELQRKVPGAKLMGPIIYRSGKVELVTKSAATNDKIKVLGIADAPILDGDFLAVGFELNAQDAEILWQTLKSPTPDVSLNFKMTIAGLNSAIGAKMEVNWDILNTHRVMNLRAEMPVLKADISDMVKELRQNGTIKVTTVGTSDLGNTLIKKVEDKILDVCFNQTIDSGYLSRDKNYFIKDGADGKSRRDKEMTRQDTDDATRKTFLEGERSKREGETSSAKSGLEGAVKSVEGAESAIKTKKKEDFSVRKVELKANIDKENIALASLKEKLTATENEDEKKKIQEEISQKSLKIAANKSEIEQIEATEKADERAALQTNLADTKGDLKDAQRDYSQKKSKSDDTVNELDDISKNGISLSDFSVEFIYHRAKVLRKGTFTMDLNSNDPVTLIEPFGGNIGKLNCSTCMMEVNTQSASYLQREVVAFLNGSQMADFDKYINFVNVRMRKRHQGGDLTYDEVRIDRKNFKSNGNAFKLMYGWQKGDNDRRNWLNYDFQTTWNFFGGYSISQDWTATNENTIAVSSPFVRSEISVSAEKEKLQAANVRNVAVKIYYKLGEREFVKRISIKPNDGILEQKIEILSPQNGDLVFDYEYDWILGDGTIKKSGRKASNYTEIYVDNL